MTDSSHRLTPEQISALIVPQDLAITRDGAGLAWAAKPQGTRRNDEERSVWVALDGADAPWKVTGRYDAWGPSWSSSGNWLAFVSDREGDGVGRTYRVSPARGRSVLPCSAVSGVQSLVWSPTSDDELAVIAAPHTEGKDANVQDSSEWTNRGKGTASRNIAMIVSVRADTARAVSPKDWHVTNVAWAPNGTKLAVVFQPDSSLDSSAAAQIAVIDLATAEPYVVCASPGAVDLVWLEHEDTLVYQGPIEPTLLSATTAWTVVVREGAKPRIVGPDVDASVCVLAVSGVQPATIVTALADGLNSALRVENLADRRAPVSYLVEGDIAELVVAENLRVGLLAEMHGGGREVWVGDPARQRRMSKYGDRFRSSDLCRVDSFRASSADGFGIDVVAVHPKAEFGLTFHPTIVLPHGGPYGRSNLGRHCSPLDWGQLLASHGFLVLLPNYRGGKGRGHLFAAAARGDVGGADWADVSGAVDRAIELGLADPARLGIGGWSQGGFLAAWGITRTTRFKAAVVGAGVTDWRSLVLASDKPAYQAALAGEFPWARSEKSPDLAIARSPVTHAANVDTPVLILHGERDERIPCMQATGFDRSLHAVGADSECVIFPGAGHVIVARDHQIDVMERVVSFFLTHLGTPLEEASASRPRRRSSQNEAGSEGPC